MKNSEKGILYLVPVPLSGGVPDSSIPATSLQTIIRIRVFIVEDIRSARRFLRAAGYQGDFTDIIFHLLNKHTLPEDIPSMLKEASNGIHTGLLSEAGVPCVADPGASVVSAAHKQQIKVVPVTGPSSILLALMASGFNGQHFVFHGYLPVKDDLRVRKIREIELETYQKDQTQIMIETPYRNRQLFASIINTCKDHTLLCVATNIGNSDENIISKPVTWWKSNHPDLHKKPTVFLLYR